MENPPVNYNPNESLFNGGTESSIMKVMGGGGDSLPSNYNENLSLLEINGGNSINIEMVKGGGDTDNIMIVNEYTDADEETLNNFIKKLTPNVNKAIKILERLRDNLEIQFNSSFLKYKIQENELISSASNSRNNNIKKIVFVPSNTKTLIVLPHVDNALVFLNILDFLLNTDYITIEKNKIKLKRNIFIVGLTPFNLKDNNLYYLYLQLKVNNFHSYFVADEPFTIIYPKDKGILFTSKDKKLEKPDESTLGVDIEEIQRYGIKKMAYKSGNGFYDTIDIISTGDEDPLSTPSGYTFTLNKSIAIISLKYEDIKTINVDMLGRKFRIRLPLSSDTSKDFTYKMWKEQKWNKDEKELINYLGLDKFEGLDIPQFLFYLTYYKCFNDVSLLTKQECSNLRANFERIYMNILKQYDINIDDNSINMVDFNCQAVKMSDGNILCEVKYPKAGQYDLANIVVEIDGSNLDLVNDPTKKDELKAVVQKSIEQKRFKI
jgi:hypothetical protein